MSDLRHALSRMAQVKWRNNYTTFKKDNESYSRILHALRLIKYLVNQS